MDDPKFISVEAAARQLGLPCAWLKDEVQTGRISAIRAGRRLLVNPAEVERVLLERAQKVRGEVTDER